MIRISIVWLLVRDEFRSATADSPAAALGSIVHAL